MTRRLGWRFWVWCLCLICVLPARPGQARQDAPLVLVLSADGVVSRPMVEYLERGIRTAGQRGAELLVLELNTPGGSISLMQDMVEAILASPVPVLVYITPRGAMAGSAGTVITLAGHAAAMAPETAIGAASPVGSQGEDLGETMQAKEKNILRAQVRSLAGHRGAPAVDLAERTIEEAAAASASEALEVGLVDFIAADRDDLLRQAHGHMVTIGGEQRSLNTTGAVQEELPRSLIEQLLDTLASPNIVFLLISIGVQAILIEISSPGGWVAGFIGVVCLSLATYGLGVLPVNWFGGIFLLTAFVLFVLDIKAPTHGALTAAGVASLIVGALVLFNSPGVPSFQRVSVPLIVTVSVLSGLMFFGILIVALRSRHVPARMGQESLPGQLGTVRVELAPSGSVQLAGELWSAELAPGEEPLPVGTPVQVVAVKGLRLVVRKAP